MNPNWQTKKLSEICKISAGNSAPQKKELFIGGKYPFFRTSDVGKIHIGNISESFDLLNEEGIKGLKLFNKGTILLPKSGASIFLNHRVILGIDGYVSSHLATIITDEKILNNSFLFYFLQEIKSQDLIQDNKYPSLNLPVIGGIETPFPSLPEQQRIVKTLDEAFEKIEKVKKIAEKNLQNSRELFESYLLNIDAKKEPLGNLIDIKTGKLDANAATTNGIYPFFTCSREIFAIDKYAFDCEAILLAGNNASGDFNVKHYNGKFNAYQRTYVITVNNKNGVLYRYLYFQLLNSLKEFKEKSVGANTRFLKIGMIRDMEISLPTLVEQKLIVKKLDKLSTETKKLETIYKQKLADLEELKKSILTKAFNGEL